MEKAGLYVRLSDEDENKVNKEDLSKSIINQIALLEDYAKQHGYEVYKIYCDDDYSGLYDDRPQFTEMINDAKMGKINTIIAKSQSRFSRNMEHIEKYLHNDFIEWGVRFIGVVDGTDTAIRSNKKSRQIYSMTNEWYCEDLSDSVHAVFDTKMKNGEFIGSFAPYGYKKDPINKNKLIVDEEAAQVVRRIFNLYISGESISGISRILCKERIPTPAVYKKQQGLTYKYKQKYDYCEKYGYWAETTIRRILKNKSYLGSIVQGKTRKINYKNKKMFPMPEERWVVVDNMHEAIISEEEFELVQKIALARVRRPKKAKVPYILSGKIKCAECGSTIVNTGKNPSGTRTYARCQLYKKSNGQHCTPHKIIFQEIEEIVLEQIRALIDCVLDNEDDVEELSKILQLNDSDIQERKHVESKLAEFEKKKDEAKQMIKNLYLDKANGIISTAMYCEMSKDYEKSIAEYTQRMEVLSNKLKTFQENEKKVKDYCAMVREYCQVQELNKEIVNRFIDYIEISETDSEPKQKVIIHWNI